MAKGYSYVKLPNGWKCALKYKGHRKSRTFKNKSAAENWARRITNLIDEGKYNGKDAFARQQSYSLLDRFTEMIEDMPVETRKNEKRKKDYNYLKNIIEHHGISKMPFDQVTTDNLKEFINERRAQGTSESTISNNLSMISRVYTYAQGQQSWKFNGVNPYSLLDRGDRPRPSDHRERRLYPGEYEIILDEAIKQSTNRHPSNGKTREKYLPYLFRFQANSGLRLGEVADMQPNYEMFDKGLVYLNDPKNANPRWVPLTKDAWRALEDFKPYWGKKTIFSSTSAQMSKCFMTFKNNLLFKDIIRENLTMHDLRHESLSRLFEMYDHDTGHGVLNLADILLISGHLDVRTLLEKYVKINPLDTARKLRANGSTVHTPAWRSVRQLWTERQ